MNVYTTNIIMEESDSNNSSYSDESDNPSYSGELDSDS